MLQSKGVKRTLKHNMFLAIFFAFTAGIVNIYGFVNLGVFTTNVTGHVGEFALAFELSRWLAVKKITFWPLAFGLGSFSSALIIGFFEKKHPWLSYAIPILTEIILLIWCLLIHDQHGAQSKQILILLFAMGLQNGIVSVVSGKVVRTTHLTGMITDIGIGLCKFLLRQGNKFFVLRSLLLNISVVFSFIIGGILSAFLTITYQENVLLLPIGLLISALIFDFNSITKTMNKMLRIRDRLPILK